MFGLENKSEKQPKVTTLWKIHVSTAFLSFTVYMERSYWKNFAKYFKKLLSWLSTGGKLWLNQRRRIICLF
jgi:hypothetical protein